MDAVPIRMSQELIGWAAQLGAAIERIESALPRVLELPIGGTAVGTGLNTHPRFGGLVVAGIRRDSGVEFTLSRNFFAGISSQDASLELSAQLRGLAVALLKISNDLRMMNSGPVAGLAEISLPVNPVIPEAER